MTAREGRAPSVLGRDGIMRSAEVEAEISNVVHACFSTPAGQRCLDYLRSITTNRTLGPAASDAELRDLEGQRRLVAMLFMRMEDARRIRERDNAAG